MASHALLILKPDFKREATCTGTDVESRKTLLPEACTEAYFSIAAGAACARVLAKAMPCKPITVTVVNTSPFRIVFFNAHDISSNNQWFDSIGASNLYVHSRQAAMDRLYMLCDNRRIAPEVNKVSFVWMLLN